MRIRESIESADRFAGLTKINQTPVTGRAFSWMTHMDCRIRWDTLSQKVVTMNEAPGSNEFLTRDQIGRALYNCLVLGCRHDMMIRMEYVIFG